MKNNRPKILDVSVDPLTYSRTLTVIEKWINNSKKSYICVAAVHLIMECQNNPPLLRGINAADLVTPDGMPLIWILKKRGFKNIERIYGPDLMDKICKLAEKNGYRIFILGGAKEQSKQVVARLKDKYPKLRIAGNQDTPDKTINGIDNKKIIGKINNSQAQIVLIGIGCPYQEIWMIKNRKKLRANILVGVGAAFNFLTGNEKQAPWWIQQIGLEWLFRFIQNPKSLWYRYTILNIKFIYCLYFKIQK